MSYDEFSGGLKACAWGPAPAVSTYGRPCCWRFAWLGALKSTHRVHFAVHLRDDTAIGQVQVILF